MSEKRPRRVPSFRVLVLGLTIATVLSGAIFRERLLGLCGQYLVTERALEPADAIVVLSGGVPERILEAVDVYKAGYAPRLILTRAEKPENLDLLRSFGVAAPEGYEINLHIARRLGVPDEAIVLLEPRVNSTYMELGVVRDYCLRQGLHSVIMVTSKSHTTRAYKIFHHLADGRIRVIPHASRYDTFDPTTWWTTRRTAKEVLFEYEKLVHYYLIVLTGG